MRVLLVEDDPPLGAAVRDHMVADGHSVDWVRRLADADDCLGVAPYGVLLLDLMLPDGRGVPFLRRLRRRGVVAPVIILTARDQLSDRIEGLNAGADDYLVKPFDLPELSARVAAVGRRYAGAPNPAIMVGDLEINLSARTILRAGRMIPLTAREWAVVETLAQRPGRILSKSQIEDNLYDFSVEVESNVIEAHISRLRRKLGHGAIETVRGLGYRMPRS